VGDKKMIWRHLTSLEIGNLDKSIPVVLPIGAIEQHGPHLNVETDVLISEFICNQLNKELKDDVLILPSLAVCASGHHMDFAGTLTVSHSTLILYLKELIVSIIQNGFKNIIIFNGHGGNQSLGSVVIESLGLEYPQCNLTIMTWWKIASKELLKITETGLFGVGHACEFETSLMQYIDGFNVREEKIENGPVEKIFDWAAGDLLRGSKAPLHRSMKEMTKNGIYGDPRVASKEKGAKIVKVVMANFIPMIKDMKIKV
jgi:creatinine amidohydrolase